MEMPNRRFPVPPPFMFHPELQPELAERNPKHVKPLTIPRRGSAPRAKPAKRDLGISLVPAGEEKRFCMPQMVGPRTLMRTAALYEYKHESYLERLEPLKTDLESRVMEHFFNEDDRPESLLGDSNE